MFEGLVQQLLLGYLGRYFKDIQKEQLKIRLEVVLLENVELILEAFDYLQLPFALKQGRVGRLSIKIPWKKPWDPIIIILEDVFVSASQRDDQEWGAEAVEKREFAGKKAKLAAAELEKLSRRVSGSNAGQSFISHITAKVLDSIQVDIRNFHVLYSDMQNDMGHVMFGLKFSNLTMKQNVAGSYNARVRVGQEHKIVEIKGLEFYSSIFHGSMELVTVNWMSNSHLATNIRSEGEYYNSILAPCDVTITLSANRSHRPDDDAPQYSVSAEMSGLVVSLDECQLQQMFIVWDYVCICRLREKYGRFRPWHCPLPRKSKGWQIFWWHYAQESVLSDVRKKQKKTSWRYLGDRLSYRRKYINLYKIKLDFLQQQQPVDEDVLQDLEEMEKESDLDDILNYRSAAEYAMRELLSGCSAPNNGRMHIDIPTEKSSIDDHAVKSRGWLNWLSRGMLGAGGTDDSSQFSGVVSFDVEDISEATEFHPVVSSSLDIATKHELCTLALKIAINQISATLHSKRYGKAIAEIILEGGIVESKLYKEHGVFLSKFKFAKVVLPNSQEVIVHIRRPFIENNTSDIDDHACSIQVDFSSDGDTAMSVKGVLQQIQVMFDGSIFLNLLEFYDVFTTFKFHNERVLLSLNGMKNDNARLLSKAEYVFANNKKVMWEITIFDVSVNIPWRNTAAKYCNLLMNSRSLCLKSTENLESFSSNDEDHQPYCVKSFLNSISASDICIGIQLQDLYNYFDVRLDDFQITLIGSDQSEKVSILQKLSATFFLASCVIPDESILKQLEVYVFIAPFKAHFSPSIYGAILELITYQGTLHLSRESETLNWPYPPNVPSVTPKSSTFGISISSKFGSVDLEVDFENSGDNSSELLVSLQEIDMRYGSTEFQELFLSIRSLMVSICEKKDEKDSLLVLSSGNLSSPISAVGEESVSGPSNEFDQHSDAALSGDACFAMHYESPGTDLLCHKCIMYLNNTDIHCYPHIVGLFVGFFNMLSSYNINFENSACSDTSEVSNILSTLGSQKFGFSNYFEFGSSDSACIPVDHFPFVTIHNTDSLHNLESALIYAIPEWRKYFTLRDKKIRCSKINMRRRSRFSHISPSKSRPNSGYLKESGIASISNVISIELHVWGIRVHFHDSSCIIGTIMVPTSKSCLLFCEESFDISSSFEGLVLTSSWWGRNFQDYLWGPCSNLSPILNVRVRKGKNISSTIGLEVSISVQHVYCMLPSEYLSIIIGYFSLAEWGGDSSGRSPVVEQSDVYVKNEMSITVKFEVLDSTLIFPVESNEYQYLKVEMRQLYGSFIENSGFDNILKSIPPECLVPVQKLAKRNNCVNVFARDVYLLFVLCKNDMYGSATIEQNTEFVLNTLIAPINADVWVRIPYGETSCNSSSSSICCMTNISSCYIIAEESNFLDGCLALLDVIDEFSTVEDKSKCFQSDLLQFLDLKRSLKATGAISTTPGASMMILTEIKCHTQSLLISFCHKKEDSVELIAKGDFQFICSASLVNDSLVSIDVGFSTLVLYSPHDSMLAKFSSAPCSTLVLEISFSKSLDSQNEVSLSLSSLDVWLHLCEWTEVLKFLNHLSVSLDKNVSTDATPKSLSFNAADSVKMTARCDASNFLDSDINSLQFTSQEAENVVLMIVKSNLISISFHIPVWVSEEPCLEFQLSEGLKVTPLSASSDLVEEKDTKFLTVTLNMNGFEFFMSSRDFHLKSNMEKLSCVIMTLENGRYTSSPLCDIFQVHVEAVLCKNPTNTTESRVEIICDHSDVWLSHPAFYLWGAIKFDIPKSGSSQYSACGIAFKFNMRKVSILLTDGKWSYNGAQMEILVRNILFHVKTSEKLMECSVTGDLQVNYNNIEKVSWEPFIEPWQLLLTLVREQETSTVLSMSVPTEIIFKSTTQLNINITESLVECVSRTTEMLLDVLGLVGLNNYDGNKLIHSPYAELMCTRRCGAPYVLQNLTSVPLLYHVYHGPLNPDELYDSNEKYGKYVNPGSTIPIYMDENTEERLSRYRPSHSSDSLNDQRLNGFAHHYITVQLEGTPMPSNPMSMDLVGVTYFEVNFSKTYNENDEDGRMSTGPTFIVPVVFDVSVLRYSKLIRIYSTVVLQNATSIPLELRFDIPFGVSPTILDPIHPGKQLPLPLHLAEAGFVRWRPMGSSYLWSEAHNLSNLLSVNSRVGNLKSFVCYPSHPSSHPFRCCLSVKNISLTSSGWMNSNISADDGKKRYIHHLILSAPLIISNYLPKEVLLVSESSGVNHTVRVSEVETSVYHIDPSHDLGVEICIDGFKHSDFKFPRLENFCTLAKFSETETKFSLSETLIFEPTNSDGHMYVTVEKVIDVYSGSREVIIYVPFILYNCMGFPMCIKETTSGSNQRGFVIPSYYDFCENETISTKKDGLSLLSSSHELHAEVPLNPRSFLKNHTISCREDVTANTPSFPGSSLLFSGNYHGSLGRQRRKSGSTNGISSLGRSKNTAISIIQSTWKDFGSGNQEHGKVGPCMYSPAANSAINEILVKLSRYFPGDASEQLPFSLWSSPFSLLPPSGSSTILVPQLASNSAFIVAVTSNTIGEQYTGRTNAITFQPRFVISNACSKEISYKQKGTDVIFYLGIGEHAHLHWTDMTRELLVSICYNESGWQWSGSFLPDHLGDTQLKMRNIVFGTSDMIRVEVQNADISMGDEKIIGSIKGNSGTNLILLSDDDTGYMPYRIDNFSKERLRIYQQKCEMFDTVIHSYSSYPYTWDEPCYPHRLTVEVPGERVLGSYALDDVKEYRPVCLPPTSEKPERTFFLSVHAEGATKVLSILDSNYHIFNDVKKSDIRQTADKRLYDHKQVKLSEYKEKISIFIPCIGISLINSYSQELLFGCIKDMQIELLQSLDRQSLSLQIPFLQIDNQLRTTPYPVMLSFDSGYKSCAADNVKYRDDVGGKRIEKLNQISIPVFSLEISKWRKKDISFISFEYIKLRMADFRLEIEQEVILSLFEFFTNITCGMQCGIMASSDHYEGASLKDSSFVQTEKLRLTTDQCPPRIDSFFNGKSKKYVALPSITPIGAPWQDIYLLARTQKKVYIEILELAPIKMTLSFSSAPWMLHNRILTSKEFLIHRGLMALADVEGAQIYLKDLSIAHHMASWESIQEILIRHYNRQLLHEIYKVFGSAGVIGNPLGFVRSMGLGIRDFLSVPAKSIMQSPTGLVTGMAQGTSSLLSNTVYAISDAASQFSKAARKGIVAFTYDDQAVSRMEKHQATVTSDSKGVINEVLEGLTGLLQSPVRGAEKHGLPGVLSGVALGITGLVAKPAASILEVTGKTALSIRNRSKPNQLRSQCFRIRLPRPLSHERPLKPYSWEEAVGISVLLEAEDGLKFKDEKLVACKALKESGKFVVLTERFVLIVFSPWLVTLSKPEFPGIPADLEWIIEWEIGLENIVYADAAQAVVHIVSSRPDSLLRQNHHSPKRSSSRTRAVHWNHNPTHLPLPQTNLELSSEEDATNLLQLLLSAIEEWKGKASHCGRILHRANLRTKNEANVKEGM